MKNPYDDNMLEFVLNVYDICRRGDAKPSSPPATYYPLLCAIERVRRSKGAPSSLELPEDRKNTAA